MPLDVHLAHLVGFGSATIQFLFLSRVNNSRLGASPPSIFSCRESRSQGLLEGWRSDTLRGSISANQGLAVLPGLASGRHLAACYRPRIIHQAQDDTAHPISLTAVGSGRKNRKQPREDLPLCAAKLTLEIALLFVPKNTKTGHRSRHGEP